jgi:hypothetical protein
MSRLSSALRLSPPKRIAEQTISPTFIALTDAVFGSPALQYFRRIATGA